MKKLFCENQSIEGKNTYCLREWDRTLYCPYKDNQDRLKDKYPCQEYKQCKMKETTKPKLIETVGNLAVMCAEKPNLVLTFTLGNLIIRNNENPNQCWICGIYENELIEEFKKIVREL